MDPLQQRKQVVLNFIVQAMPQISFDRGVRISDDGKVGGFNDYQAFQQHQINTLNQFNAGSIQTLEALIQIVRNSAILDEESMIEFNNGGFYFNRQNQIVFIQSR